MVDDVAAVWGGQIRLGRQPANNEILVGNTDGNFALAASSTISPGVQALLDGISTTQGAVLYRGASAWAALPPGTSGQFLSTNGAAANPSWASAAAIGIQAALDSISSTQGTILYRSNTAWVALAPGTSGQVLSTNGTGANPSWVSTSAINIQTALDSISSTQGTILYRSNTAWVALSPGTSGQFLSTNGSGANPSWAAPTTNIQTALDSISSTQGTILYRGASSWTALAPGTAGQVLSTNGASANPSWVSNSNPWSYGVKTADQSVASSTALVDATDMSFSVAANTYYTFSFNLYFTQNLGGIRVSMTFPTSPNALLYAILESAEGAQASGTTLNAFGGGSSANLEYTCIVNGFLNNGANAGTVQFRFAQALSNANATVMKKGSWFQYRTV